MQQKRLTQLRANVKGCQTWGDVWRLAYARGYSAGHKRASRTYLKPWTRTA